jgi:ADP-ribose pyrophosphatase YjhB (NUDIX family)
LPSVVVPCVPLRLVHDQLAVWLRPVANGVWSLPGEELHDRESIEHAVRRVIASLPFAREVTRHSSCGVFSEPARVPHRHEIAIASWIVVRAPVARTGEAAMPADPLDESPRWFPIDELPRLVDDHLAIVRAGLDALRRETLADPVTRRLLPRHLLFDATDEFGAERDDQPRLPPLFGLLPDPFPLSAIRRFYEMLFAEELVRGGIDRGNFRRKLLELKPTGVLKDLPIFQKNVRHRAAQLFTFDPRAWERWIAGEATAGDRTDRN